MGSPYRIRLAERRDDYDACVDLQRKVWSLSDLDLTSALHLVNGVHAGGIVQIAETEGGQPIGFAWAQPALRGGVAHFQSDMLAVLPQHQKMGVGLRLKWAQRDEALARGVKLVTWTFDPLRARNAHLNLRRLGAVAPEFLPDFFGAGAGRGRHLSSDRLAVRWVLDDPRVVRLHEGGDLLPIVPMPELPRINEVVWQAGWPICSDPDLELDAPELLLEIPPEYDVLAGAAPRVAEEWHVKVRQALSAYMDRGYVAADFAPTEDEGRRRPFYVLRRS